MLNCSSIIMFNSVPHRALNMIMCNRVHLCHALSCIMRQNLIAVTIAIHIIVNYDKYSCCIYMHVFCYDGINMIIKLTFHFIERRRPVGCGPGLHSMFPGHGAGVRPVWMAGPHPPVLPQISAQETPRIQLTPYSFQCHKISTYAENGLCPT